MLGDFPMAFFVSTLPRTELTYCDQKGNKMMTKNAIGKCVFLRICDAKRQHQRKNNNHHQIEVDSNENP